MISLQNIEVCYGKESAIENVSFVLDKGSTLSLIGANGSGKSTILKAIANIIPISKGDIYLKSTNKIAYLGQFNEFNKTMPISVQDLILTGLYADIGLFGKITAEHTKLIYDAMDFLEITHLAKKRVSSLSGGQKQRALLATILVKNTEIVLLDEPTNNLDTRGIDIYYKMVEKLKNRGCSIVVATHNLQEAKNSDLVAILYNKNIVSIGKSSETLRPEILLKAFGG